MAAVSRIAWVDTARGICMMAILLFHSENYYAGEEILPYPLYVDNAVATFFFLSGYLFYDPKKAFSVRHKLVSVLKGMLIPYLLFTTAIAFPKAFVHDDTSLADTFSLILTGHASWFIAALMVAEVLFCGLLRLSRGKLFVLGAFCALSYIFIAILSHFVSLETREWWNFWCWQNACMNLIFIYFGHVCRCCGEFFHRFHRTSFIILLFIFIIFYKYMILESGWMLTMQPIHVDSFTVLLADGLLGSLLLTGICRRLPSLPMIEWTGRNSLFYYFICGGVPLLVSRTFIMVGIPYTGSYLPVIPLFLTVYAVASAIVWCIVKVKDTFQ